MFQSGRDPEPRRGQSCRRPGSGCAQGSSATAACGWAGAGRSGDADVTTRTVQQGELSYVVTDLAAEDFDEYYNGFANRVLWPILHYRLDLAEFSRRDLSGYLRVNEHFADQLADGCSPTILSGCMIIT